MYRTRQYRINQNHIRYDYCRDICRSSAVLYNRANFILRQYSSAVVHLGMIISRFVPDENVVLISATDGSLPGMNGLRIIHNDLEKKANLAMSIMMNALEKKFDVKHEYKVL